MQMIIVVVLVEIGPSVWCYRDFSLRFGFVVKLGLIVVNSSIFASFDRDGTPADDPARR
jgi:hypothetical protein